MKHYQIVRASEPGDLEKAINDLAKQGYQVERMAVADDGTAGESLCWILLSKEVKGD